VQATPLLVLVPGMTIVLMTAGIDLSVGSMVVLVACIMSTFEPSTSFWLTAVPLGLLLAVAAGAFSGLLIAGRCAADHRHIGDVVFYRGLYQVALGSQERGTVSRSCGIRMVGDVSGSLVLATVLVVGEVIFISRAGGGKF
jgi:ribose/xylose/arabinose/galactoside ABC-type transport system permease subunit